MIDCCNTSSATVASKGQKAAAVPLSCSLSPRSPLSVLFWQIHSAPSPVPPPSLTFLSFLLGCRGSWGVGMMSMKRIKEKKKNPSAAVYEGADGYCTCEVISVHSMEQQETNEEDKTNAGDYHSAQQEAIAAFSLDNLGMR